MIKQFKTCFFVIICLFLICALIVLFFYPVVDAGIQSINFYNKDNKVYLKINYVDCKGYSVEKLDTNATYIRGERVMDCTSLIGENAVKISLFDIKISEKFEKEFKKNHKYFEAYNLKLKEPKTKDNFNIKFMVNPIDEHSLEIFVGFDSSFQRYEKENTEINFPIGTIQLELGEYK